MILRNFFLVSFTLIVTVSILALEETEGFEPAFPPHAIMNASYIGDVEMVRKILATNPDKDVRDFMGDTALHLAMFQKDVLVVKLLLDHGFDPNARATKNGFTPLHIAVIANNAAAARLLLQYGADKRIRCLQGQTPLDKAREGDKKALVSMLM